MKNVLLSAAILLCAMLLYCSSNQGGAPAADCKKCEGDLASAQIEISKLKADLASAQIEISKLKADLAGKDKTIEALKSTPEQKYQALLDAAKGATGANAISAVQKEAHAFIDGNPTSPLVKNVKTLLAELVVREKAARQEEERQAAVNALDNIKSALSGIDDGSELGAAPIMKLAGLIEKEYTLGVLKRMPSTNYKAAMKDADAERGRVMTVRGSVVQISKQAAAGLTVYEGVLLTGGWDAIHYIAVGSTKEIYEKSQATFVGVFAQTYSYPNAGGGTTHSVVLVGYFEIAENK
jgi:hypothetical protein